MKYAVISLLVAALAIVVGCSPSDGDGGDDVGMDEDAGQTADAPPGEVRTTVVILDTTPEQSCMPEDPLGAGADIFAVALESESGEPIAWGEHVPPGSIQSADNPLTDPAPIDGDPPELEDGRICPRYDMDNPAGDNYVSLGCSGSIAVRFKAEGETVDLTVASRNRIRVYEAGPQCGSSDDETYQVAVCAKPEDVEGGDRSSCGVILGDGLQGEEAVPLQNF